MLMSLGIRDLAVIERIDLEFGTGLTVLTGETGAGKSILLDALGLATGKRAETGLVRPGAERATVSAVFSLSGGDAIAALLEEHGLEAGEELLVRRQVQADGRSRAFINDEPVGVTLLAALGEHLVEVHGQHDQRGLMRPETHRQLLDAFGGHGSQRKAVGGAFAALREARSALEAMTADAARLQEHRETLARDVEELDRLEPRSGEDEELAALRSRLANAQKIAEALTQADKALEDEDGVDARLRRAASELARIREVAAGSLDETIAALDRALVEVGEVQEGIARTGRDLDADAGRLEEVEERLFALRAAARRHKTTVDDLPRVHEALARQLADLSDHAGSTARLRQALADAEAAFDKACAALTKARAKAAAALDKAVARELEPLRMGKAVFTTRLLPLEAEDRGGEGAERVQFEVVTNPGSPPGPLNKIASGGELSRFMLALKVAAQKGGAGRTLVFDEIDAGIGGAVADAVGERLQGLGRDAQVLVVTHAPQVAARADRHIRLVKTGDAASVATSASELDRAERREELARMLAGAEITDAARAAAESLLKTGAS
jgi:DNA repair protein RecN (Recombination protein N)